MNQRLLPPECLDRLSEATRDRIEGLAEDPRALVGLLRDDVDAGLALVECDTVTGLGRWFVPVGGWSVDPGHLAGRLGDAAFGVAWVFHGRHDRPEGEAPGPDPSEPPDPSPLGGVPLTGREVFVRGFTVVAAEEDGGPERLVVRRYVDWAAVFAQVGLTLNWRVPLSP